jgi:DNA-binding FrmR family transcriptional regulator
LTNTPWGYIIKLKVRGESEKVLLKGGIIMENCCCKTKKRSDEEKRALINRLSRIEGQIRGIRSMVENDAYCADILTQSSAASAAMGSFNRELLDSHVRTCVAEGIKNGDEEKLDELDGLFFEI